MKTEEHEGASPKARMAFALGWVALWAVLIHQVSPDGASPAGPIVHDAANYLSMTSGHFDSAIAPFRYRVGLPFLASLLPLPAHQALTVVSLCFLCAALFLWSIAAKRLGLSTKAMIFAAVATASTQGWANALNNPLLTDASGHFFDVVLWLLWLTGASSASVVVMMIAPLFRETTLVLGALQLFSRHRVAGVVGLVAGLAVVVVAHRMLATPDDTGLLATVQYVYETKGPVRIIGDVFASFHGLWLIAVFGCFELDEPQRRAVLLPLALSLTAALALSFAALNTVRMFSFATPFMAIAWGVFASRVFSDKDWRMYGFSLFLLMGGLVWFPNRLWGSTPQGFQYLLGVGTALVGLWLWRRSPKRAQRESAESQ